MTKTDRHILILRFSALGDVAMTLPVIYSVAAAYPQTQFTMVTRPFFARLFINRPKNLNIIGLDPKEYSGVAGTLRLMRRLKALRPTAVADLHNMLRTWLIDNYFRAHGVKVAMVDKRRTGRRKALRECSQQPSFIDRYVDVFKRLGFEFEPTFTSVLAPDNQPPLEIARPAVGIAPFARYFSKTYPQELMLEVIKGLVAKGINVYLFGGRGKEAETLKDWADATGSVSLAGRHSIEDELALMSGMDAIVSMDSANQHLASLSGTKVVTIWGATTPECGFMPYRQPESSAIINRTDCQPCSVGGTPGCHKGHFNCMRGIKPATVVNRVIKTIENAKP